MIKKILKISLIVFASVVIFLITTNPGMAKFKDYNNNEHRENWQRTSNYLLFSTYVATDYYSENNQVTTKYLGIALNFFEIDY